MQQRDHVVMLPAAATGLHAAYGGHQQEAAPCIILLCITHSHQPSAQPALQVGAETFRLCRELVDGVTLVDNAAISAAIKDVFNETRSILEPAGAVAVAGAKAWLKANGHKGKKVVAVTSGANINFERLRLVSELADLGAMTEAMLATTIPERQGAFRAFVDTATSGTGISVTEFKYRWGQAGEGMRHAAGLHSRLHCTLLHAAAVYPPYGS